MTEPNGFYYMKARYYDPKVGRFVSEDPSGFEGGDVNLMAYVGNNPVNGIDPFGLASNGLRNSINRGPQPKGVGTADELLRQVGWFNFFKLINAMNDAAVAISKEQQAMNPTIISKDMYVIYGQYPIRFMGLSEINQENLAGSDAIYIPTTILNPNHPANKKVNCP